MSLITCILYIVAGLVFVISYKGREHEDPTKRKIYTVLYYASIIYIVVTLIPDALRLKDMFF